MNGETEISACWIYWKMAQQISLSYHKYSMSNLVLKQTLIGRG